MKAWNQVQDICLDEGFVAAIWVEGENDENISSC